MTTTEGEKKPNELDLWLESEGREVYSAIDAIYYFQHVDAKLLKALLGEEIAELLPSDAQLTDIAVAAARRTYGYEFDSNVFPVDLMTRLIDRLPVRDLRNAVYIPSTDRLLLGSEYAFLTPRGFELDDYVEILPEFTDLTTNPLMGLTATVKSNGWKIFHAIETRLLKKTDSTACANGLLSRGYIPLIGSKQGYRRLI